MNIFTKTQNSQQKLPPILSAAYVTNPSFLVYILVDLSIDNMVKLNLAGAWKNHKITIKLKICNFSLFLVKTEVISEFQLRADQI